MTIHARSELTRHHELVQLIKRNGSGPRRKPVVLADGSTTQVYLDVKGILTSRDRLDLAAQVMWQWADELSLPKPTAIGGPTMGADAISIAMVLNSLKPVHWFSVRDKPKTTHGLGKAIEGKELGPNDSVILTDDVANSGDSLLKAYNAVRETGATVSAVMPLVDRGRAGRQFLHLPTLYCPLIGHEHLGIQPLAA